MDQYRDKIRLAGAVSLGSILSDFAGEEGPQRYSDGQRVTVAGIVSSHKSRATRNNSMMAYVTLEDDSAFLELIVFQRALDQGGAYLADNAAILVQGRISVREDKDPQIVVDSIRPLSDLDPVTGSAGRGRTLWLKLNSTDERALRKIDLLREMFIGQDSMVQYFADLRRQRAATCLIHDALVRELKELLGEENVVIK